MKVTKEQLQRIIQEELAKELEEQELGEEQVDEIFGKIGSTARKIASRFAKKPAAPTQTTKPQAQVARFTQGPSTDVKSPVTTTSATTPAAAGTATQTIGPGEITTTSTAEPKTPAPSAVQSSVPTTSKSLEPVTKIKFLSPVEEPKQTAGQMDLFGDFLPREKEKQELKQKSEKEYEEAKKLPFQQSIAALKTLSNNQEADPEVRKKATDLLARVLKENKNSSYKATYDKWKKIIKG